MITLLQFDVEAGPAFEGACSCCGSADFVCTIKRLAEEPEPAIGDNCLHCILEGVSMGAWAFPREAAAPLLKLLEGAIARRTRRA
jgi:hypothetical protein